MVESPRPEDLGEQRTPVGPEPAETRMSAADPTSEPGPRGVAARYPYAIIVIVFAIAGALAALSMLLYYALIFFGRD